MVVHYSITGTNAAGIAASVENAVAVGDLSPGAALPPIRNLAGSLGVNPNTVATAYRSLRERGVIETSGRRGSRIRSRPATTSRSSASPIPPGVRDLSSGMPDPALLPDFAQVIGAWARREPAGYRDATVSPELEASAIRRLRADGVPVGEVAVLSGALDAIDRALGVHLRLGDAVAVEDPSWSSLLDLLGALGLAAVPVAVDDDGPIPAAVERAAQRGARALIVTSRAQNPTGAAVTRARARELRPLLSSYHLVIEDDHGADLAGVPLHTLCGRSAHWAHVRSVSKAYGPDLRVAILAGDPSTVDRVSGRQRLGPGWVSHFLQEAVVALWSDPAVARHVGLARETYATRRRALVEELARRGIRANGKTGLNVWIPVTDETAAVAGLLAAGWAVAPGARFRLDSGSAIRVTIAAVAEDEVHGLANAIAMATAGRRSTAAPLR